jgi:diguanylate cyclase (GGDEF)-like protein
VRRLLSSWTAVTVLLLGLSLGTLFALGQLQRQIEDRANRGAVETATVVSALVVQRNITAAGIAKSSLTSAARDDMDADVSTLLEQGRIVGLEVWHADGRLLYADARHPGDEKNMPLDELARSRAGRAWVGVSPDKSERGVRTLEVFLPFDPDGNGTRDGIVEVLLPEDRVADAVERSTRRLDVAGLLLFASAVAVLLLLRRRLLSREFEAYHDPLTGLLNRGALREELRDAIRDATATDAKVAALLMLDLDGFKAVNDTLGHPAGDVLLVQVGRELSASVRPGDAVVRLGGDEFAILLRNLPNTAKARAVADQLLNRLREGSYKVHDIDLSVDASIGIALIPEHGQDSDLLLQHADVAMYQAKRANAGIEVYDAASDSHDITQLGLLVELRRAIASDDLVLHYQPKARLGTGELTGVEALVRWQHPVRGLLAPAAFVPLAENTGLMSSLTEWVLRHAIAQAARWRADGLLLPVAVNISPRSLHDGDLPGTVLRLLAEASLTSDLLELEITETAIMADPEKAVSVLKHLHAMGVRVAIDDFGAGYTSLSYLKSLPVQTLKIDQTFIAEMLTSDKDTAITESVIALGHRLGMTVVAEGVETVDAWQRLGALSCDEGQGFHLAYPLPADELATWLAEHAETTPLAG